MVALVGAVLVLSGSVLIAAGMISHAVNSNHGGAGEFFGIILGAIGFIIMSAGVIQRAWDAIPTGEKRRAVYHDILEFSARVLDAGLSSYAVA